MFVNSCPVLHFPRNYPDQFIATTSTTDHRNTLPSITVIRTTKRHHTEHTHELVRPLCVDKHKNIAVCHFAAIRHSISHHPRNRMSCDRFDSDSKHSGK